MLRNSCFSRFLFFLKNEEMEDLIAIMDHGEQRLKKDFDLKTILDNNRNFRFEVDQV